MYKKENSKPSGKPNEKPNQDGISWGYIDENNNRVELDPVTKPIPDKNKDYIIDVLNYRSNLYRESWNLDIGDKTSQGYTIVGQTDEGFGYIELKESDPYYQAYLDAIATDPTCGYGPLKGAYPIGIDYETGKVLIVQNKKDEDDFWNYLWSIMQIS